MMWHCLESVSYIWRRFVGQGTSAANSTTFIIKILDIANLPYWDFDNILIHCTALPSSVKTGPKQDVCINSPLISHKYVLNAFFRGALFIESLLVALGELWHLFLLKGVLGETDEKLVISK